MNEWRLNVRHLLFSPALVAGVSGLIAVMSFFVSKELYYTLVWEELDTNLVGFLYIIICIVGFFLGIFLAKYRNYPEVNYSTYRESLFVVRNLKTIGLVFFCINVVVGLLIFLYFNQAVSESVAGERSVGIVMREVAGERLNEMGVSYIIYLNVPFLYAAMYIRGFSNINLLWLISFFVLLFILQSRGPISSLLFGLLIVAFFKDNSGSFAKVIFKIFASIILIFFLFLLVQHLRTEGGGESGGVIRGVWEYYVASYNRFYYLVEGRLTFPGAGTGYYITQWFWEFPIVSKVFGLDSLALNIFGELPPSGFLARTNYIAAAGLDWRLTAFTIFGHVYNDVGVFGVFLFCIYGYCSQVTYRKALSGSLAAILVYPFLWWSIAEWRGYIEIARPVTVFNIMVAVIVANVKIK